MKNRITVRLDDELTKLLAKLKNKSIFNLSGLIREALKDKLNNFVGIDNSEYLKELKKDEE